MAPDELSFHRGPTPQEVIANARKAVERARRNAARSRELRLSCELTKAAIEMRRHRGKRTVVAQPRTDKKPNSNRG